MAAPAIGVRPGWQQPLGRDVDWSHPLSAGLLFCGGADGYDRVKGRLATSTGAYGLSPYGRTSQRREWSYASTTDLAFTSGPWSVACVAVILTTGVYSSIFSRSFYTNEATNAGWVFGVRPSGAAVKVGITAYSQNFNAQSAYATLATNTIPPVGPVVLVMTSDGTTRQAWVNGVSMGSVTDNPNPGSAASASPNLTLGEASNAAALLGAAWGRCLSTAEAQMFYADPFQMLRR